MSYLSFDETTAIARAAVKPLAPFSLFKSISEKKEIEKVKKSGKK